jgi:putative tryptophan/tyrosine transport system substrate-binding protein
VDKSSKGVKPADIEQVTNFELDLNRPTAKSLGIIIPEARDAAATALGVDAIKISVRTNFDVVRMIDAFAASPNGGLVMPPPPSLAIRDTILEMAVKHRLPTISGYSDLAVAGTLLSYGANAVDHYRGAASYIDRLLRGAKVSDLPVQFPTRYELLVNLKAAKAIDLSILESFLLRADELIE